MKRLFLAVPISLLAACAPDSPTPIGPLTTTAFSAASAGTAPKLSVFKGGGASIAWSSAGGSSPGDATNDAALQIVTGTTFGSAAGAYTYGKDEDAVGIVGRKVGQINRLGFDSRGYLGAGSPRISLLTTGNDGNHTYFLSAFHCNPGASQGSWVTSNFKSSSCTIYRDGAVPFAGLGAAAVVADANNEVVIDWFLIQDEGPAIVYIDRLTVQNWQWVRGGGAGTRSCLDLSPPCIG